MNSFSLAHRWWALALRGAAAILFGILTFVSPRITLVTLVFLFGIYALVDGVFTLVHAAQGAHEGRRWGSMVFEGVLSVGAGLVTLFWPAISALALLFLIAVRSVVLGISELVTAVRLRKRIRGEWLMGLSGVLSVAFGVLLFLYPGAGAVAVAVWIGAYAMVFGVLLVALALRLRAWSRGPEHRAPTGGIPTAT